MGGGGGGRVKLFVCNMDSLNESREAMKQHTVITFILGGVDSKGWGGGGGGRVRLFVWNMDSLNESERQ